ncbi:MAG TPA: hypothetical protein VL995_04140 [Cellvibrio sp.]|nr:hypothetical protein [Cellvibrio sp.]
MLQYTAAGTAIGGQWGAGIGGTAGFAGFGVGAIPGSAVGAAAGAGIGAATGYVMAQWVCSETGLADVPAANDDTYESDDGCIYWYEELTELKDELSEQCLDDLTKKAINDSIAHYNRQCRGYTPYISPL